MAKKKIDPALTYAAWLLASDYVPFDGAVAGYNGMRVDRAEKLLLLPESHPTRVAAVYALDQRAIATQVVDGEAAPDGWPGAYPLQVHAARTANTKK